MDASASEALEDPGSNIPFLFEPILVEIEGTHYVCLIVPRPLADLLALKKAVPPPLLALVKNVSLWNPSLYPDCSGGKVHSMSDTSGDV